VDRKDAVLLLLKQASLMARAAPSLARTLYSSTCLHLTRSSYQGLSAVLGAVVKRLFYCAASSTKGN
ncbi:hypothetical protein EFV65_09890, partial [Yersinia enterocolitica]|nr:hypothetical protein [Yersinia enterocolitica]